MAIAHLKRLATQPFISIEVERVQTIRVTGYRLADAATVMFDFV
jgi:hypothetical protein